MVKRQLKKNFGVMNTIFSSFLPAPAIFATSAVTETTSIVYLLVSTALLASSGMVVGRNTVLCHSNRSLPYLMASLLSKV